MSAHFGVVRMNGKLYKVDKVPYETDERLQERAWFCARKNSVDDATITDSHIWINQKYFGMKYKDGH